MATQETNAFDEMYARSLSDPERFWDEAAQGISWYKSWSKVLDDSAAPFSRWFVGSELNTCYNAVDRHVEAGCGEQAAIIYDSPVTNTVQTITYSELQVSVALFAGALRSRGVEKGDRVLIYMPMIPQTVIAMLACARLGAIHSVVFGGFAPNELATRIDDAKPKAIVSASCGIESSRIVKYKPMLDTAIEQAKHKPDFVVIRQRPQEQALLIEGRDVDWDQAMASAEPTACVQVKGTDPLYILYTSGTTGQPKGVVRDNAGHAVALRWSMENFYSVRPGEVFWAASDVGWVVGHSYIVYGPLLAGCTTVLFEGKPVGTPDAGTFWRVIDQHKVTTLFTAPTALRAIKREDPDALLLRNYNLSSLRALFLAGERSDPETLRWAEEKLGVPTIDHWWQTETGWVVAGNPLGVHLFPVKDGSAARPMPGWDIQVLDSDQNVLPCGKIGALCVKLPLPPGALPTLWNADSRFQTSYLHSYPGYYESGDAGYIDEDGYVHVMSRTDDIINVAGHRLSTGGMEEVLASHRDVAECAVIGVADQLKGQVPLGLLCLKAGVSRSHEDIVKEVVQLVRERIGPVADFKRAVVVERLPKTRSGKILRGTMQKIADGQDWTLPATVEDPEALSEIGAALRTVGYALNERQLAKS